MRPKDHADAAAPAGGTAGAHVLAYARRQVRAIVELEPAVRDQRPDALHRMRVATRRLRSCLRSHRAVLDRAATRRADEELGWLAAELGVDRDREVLAERLAARLDELPPALRFGPVAERLSGHAQAPEDLARVAALLDGPRYRALLQTLDSLLAAPPLRPAAARPARKVLARAVRRDRDRLAARLDQSLRTPPGPARDTALHQARKAAKRARYAAESATPALGGKARRAAGRFARVQQVLGEHQDSVLARAALLEIAAEAHAAGEPSFSYGVLHAREAELAAACEEALPELPVR